MLWSEKIASCFASEESMLYVALIQLGGKIPQSHHQIRAQGGSTIISWSWYPFLTRDLEMSSQMAVWKVSLIPSHRWGDWKRAMQGGLYVGQIRATYMIKNRSLFFKFLLLFNYSCMPFLPIPPPHPSWTHLPPPPPQSPLILSMCPL